MFVESNIFGTLLRQLLQNQYHGPENQLAPFVRCLTEFYLEQAFLDVQFLGNGNFRFFRQANQGHLRDRRNPGTYDTMSGLCVFRVSFGTESRILSRLVNENFRRNHRNPLSLDAADLDGRERLTMAGTFAVIGLRSVFEDQDLVCFALFNNRSGYLRAFDYRFANGDFAVVYDSQNFVKYDFCVFFGIQLFLRSGHRLPGHDTVCRRF
jgi:hypothetical protein